MTKKTREKELSSEELEAQNGEHLPDREAMSLIDMPGGSGPLPIDGPYPTQDELPAEETKPGPQPASGIAPPQNELPVEPRN